LPRGQGFVTFPDFENGYEALKQITKNFSKLEEPSIFATALRIPLVLVVLRTMLGFTPSEWAYMADKALAWKSRKASLVHSIEEFG
jgi:hypothetical protein